MENDQLNEESGGTPPVLSEELRQRIIKSCWGRTAGWVVEYKRVPIALLTNCSHQDPDMFWDQYDLTWLIQDKTQLAEMQTYGFWVGNPDMQFRNREFPEVDSFPGRIMISYHGEGQTIGARRLYLNVEPPLTDLEMPIEPTDKWERVKLWLRKTTLGF